MEFEPTGSDVYKRRRAEHCFMRHSNEKTTCRFFREFPDSVQSLFLKRCALGGTEIPVFGHFRDDGNWLLATTRRIFWSTDVSTGNRDYGEVKGWGWSSGPGDSIRKSPWDVDLFFFRDGQKIPGQCSQWFFVCGSDDDRHEIFVESAENLNVVFNTLLFLQRLNEIHPAESFSGNSHPE